MSASSRLSEKKRTLLAKRLQRKIGSTDSGFAEIPKKPAGALSTASPFQTNIWLIDQTLHKSATYNLTSSHRISGSIAHETLEWSLNRIVERHEILRSNYKLKGSEILQQVHSTLFIPLVIASTRDEPEARDAARKMAVEPFNLEEGPLLRMGLFSWESNRQLLVLAIHHMIADEWSLRLFWNEIESAYQFKSGHSEIELANPRLQYADYAYQQTQWLDSKDYSKQLQYWECVLADPPEPIRLQTDFPYLETASHSGALRSSLLSPETSENILQTAAEHGCSPFVILLFGYYCLLQRHSENRDILIGSPATNRDKKETASLIGYFLNTLAIRLNLDGDALITDALESVKSIVQEALSNRAVPFDRVVERLKPSRHPGRQPLIQTMFVFQRQSDAKPEFNISGCEIEPIYVETGTSRFELTLFVTESKEGFETQFEYRSDLFTPTTIDKLLNRYANLMEALTRDPRKTIRDLDMRTPAERSLVDEHGKGAAKPLDSAPLPHERFFDVARKTPAATAVYFRGDAFTYERLASVAEQVAQEILDADLEPGQAIGLYLEKGPIAISGILGVMASGHPYCMIDPGYPLERVARMLDRSGVALMLASSESSDRLQDLVIPIRFLDTIGRAGSSKRTPAHKAVLDADPAYIIFTSGSTGDPNAVEVSHLNLRHSNYARLNHYGDEVRKFLLVPRLTFDSSVAGIFWTLSTGGNLIIPTLDELRDPELLSQLISNQGIDTLLCVPSLYEQLIDQDSERLKSLKTCIVAGESCPPHLVRKHFALLPHAELFNEYGPTESTVWATVHRCRKEDAERSVIPIGRPIANTEVRVLDHDLNPVPPGATGEILIGGYGVALGYLGDAPLDAAKFITLENGKRFYRTGDLARWNEEWDLEFKGRADSQIKVRGYRIEPEEIENALTAFAEIDQAVVVVAEQSQGKAETESEEEGSTHFKSRLAAYVKLKDSQMQISMESLRKRLADKLPDYMLPSLIRQVDAYPLTTNGKIDKRALAVEGQGPSPTIGREHSETKKSAELKMLSIWKDVMGIQNLNIDDDFFEAGGDSILAIKLVARMRKHGYRVSVSQLFERPTIRSLSSPSLEREDDKIADWEGGEIVGPIPFHPIQHWFLGKRLSHWTYWNQSMRIELPANTSYDEAKAALTKLTDQHDAFRMHIKQSASGWMQVVHPQKPPGFEVLFSSIEGANDEDEAASVETLATRLHESIDPQRGHVVASAFIDRGAKKCPQLLLVCHHLVVDMFSWGIILERLNQFLKSPERPTEDEDLLARPGSYARLCRNLGSLAFDPRITPDIAFWNNQPYINPSCLKSCLDTSSNRESDSRISVQRLGFDLFRNTHGSVDIDHRKVRSMLIAALALALKRGTRHDALCIGIEGHGRAIINMELSDTVGWFTSYFPLNLDFSNANDPRDALQETEIQLGLIPNDGVSYGLLRYTGLLEPQASNMEPEIIFNYLGTLVSAEEHPLTIVQNNPGVFRHPENERICSLELNAYFLGDALRVDWSYPNGPGNLKFIESLQTDFKQNLSKMDFVKSEIEDTDATLDSPSEIKQRPPSEKTCLSYAQERIWFLEQQLGPSPVFNTCNLITFETQLDPSILQQSIQTIVNRHESLRTRIEPSRDGNPPYPVVDDTGSAKFFVDLQGEPTGLSDSVILTLAREPMDLTNGPLFRCYHGRDSQGNTLLLVKMHHIITDGLSYKILYSELIRIYSSLLVGAETFLELPEVQYSDFAYNERLPHSESAIRRDLAFWKSRLGHLPPPLSMPLDFCRPPEQSHEGALVELSLEKETADRLDRLAKKCGTTAFNVALAAYAVMLRCNSGQTDLLVGVPITSRFDHQLERVIGLFVNMVPLRLNLDEEQTVYQLIKQLSLVSREVLSHNQATFERIVREINPERDPSYPPIFQTAFMYDHERKGSWANSELRFSDKPVDTGSATYDLTLAVKRQENQYKLILEYCSALFEKSTASRFLVQVKEAIGAFIANPEQPLYSISLLGDEERNRILEEWNDTRRSLPETLTIHELVSQKAQSQPNKIAAQSRGSSLTYSELESHSNRLAHYLIDQGLKPGQLIGLCVDRSLELLTALLGILKAGCAYVPLDPNFPANRIQQILEDSGAAAIITESTLSVRECFPPSVKQIEVDRISEERNRYSPTSPRHTAKESDLAYVMYTSGSTGNPKGVAVEHRSVCNFLLSMRSRPGITEEDALLAVTTISFDISCLELFLPLVSGARVVIADSRATVDGKTLGEIALEEDITIMQATPATWRLMRAAGWTGKNNLKILCGGEALPEDLAADLLPRCAELWNLYGPTETTIWSTCDQVDRPDQISIGRPIANTQTYIVNKNNAPVPIGVVGELLIAGDGLARGYWGNESLTRNAFIPNPFQQSGRAYRTGDLARWLNDGRIECLGRADNQIKLRGFRIEPGEIENVLAEVPGVAQSVVVVQEIDTDDRRLVAFVVFKNANAPVGQELLANELGKRLPDYMIPSIFEPIDRLPLTPNGKVDRKALPKLRSTRTLESPEYAPPRTPLESKITEAMAGILKTRKIGARDNFFRAGGHSLLALQLVSRIATLTGITVSLREFFDSPTAEGLALAVVREQTNSLDGKELDSLLNEVESMDPSTKREES